MTNEIKNWEWDGPLQRYKVDGGHLYRTHTDTGIALCFVPDIDLQRYQAHLRDAYKKGFEDGQADSAMARI